MRLEFWPPSQGRALTTLVKLPKLKLTVSMLEWIHCIIYKSVLVKCLWHTYRVSVSLDVKLIRYFVAIRGMAGIAEARIL